MYADIQVLPQSKAHHQEFSWGNLTWFANRALGNSNEMTVGRCILKPGHTNGRHYHPNCSETLVVWRWSSSSRTSTQPAIPDIRAWPSIVCGPAHTSGSKTRRHGI